MTNPTTPRFDKAALDPDADGPGHEPQGPHDEETAAAARRPNAAELSRAAAAAEATAPVESTLSSYWHTYVQRLRGGDIGSLPAIGGLIVLVALFSGLQSSFRTLGSLANIIDQSSLTIFIAMGLVFVLLLGEIDLAAGTAAGVCAAILGRLSVGYGVPWYGAIPAAMAAGLLIGWLTGTLVAKVRIPSFVVTLALFLAFQGVTLFIVNNFKGTKGNISITDTFIGDLVNGHMSRWLGWVVAIVVVVGYALVKISQSASRRRAGLVGEPIALAGLKILGVAVLLALLVFLLNLNRSINKQPIFTRNGFLPAPKLEGVPWVVPLMLFFVIVWTFVLTRTRYGRHVYAVGGNAEAARRAGIPVDRIRISVFVINSFMASIGGVLLASNNRSVDQGIGGGNTLLLAVGAAVIGGTSLFGGKGRPLDAIIGGLVVAVIAYGMSNLVQGTNSSAVQFIVTGAVLLLAAAVDALARRRAGARGM